MKKEELLQQIASKLDDIPEDQLETLAKHLNSSLGEIPRCNRCANIIEYPRRACKVSVYWGYNSTGKDGDCDKWQMCEDCVNYLRRDLKIEPICGICKLSVVYVMAQLDAENPHCIYYGDVETAYTSLQTNDHCGREYAVIDGSPVCELCYEDFISTLKIPIQAGEYHFLTGEYESGTGEQRKDRIEAALKYKLTGDSVSYFFEDYVPYKNAVEIRKDLNADKKLIKFCCRSRQSQGIPTR